MARSSTARGRMHERKLPWKVLVTVPSLLTVAIAALAVDQIVVAAAAVGALAGYLGKLNGA